MSRQDFYHDAERNLHAGYEETSGRRNKGHLLINSIPSHTTYKRNYCILTRAFLSAAVFEESFLLLLRLPCNQIIVLIVNWSWILVLIFPWLLMRLQMVYSTAVHYSVYRVIFWGFISEDLWYELFLWHQSYFITFCIEEDESVLSGFCNRLFCVIRIWKHLMTFLKEEMK